MGTSAVPIFARHPILVSSQAQTTQAATHGRYTLGLALGSKATTETAFGVPYDRPIARLREFLTALRALLADGSAEFRGDILTAVTPMPAAVAGATPPVPVLVAAMGPQALRVTGELADGTLPLFATPQVLARHIVPAVAGAAARAGRGGASRARVTPHRRPRSRRGHPRRRSGTGGRGHRDRLLRPGPVLPAHDRTGGRVQDGRAGHARR